MGAPTPVPASQMVVPVRAQPISKFSIGQITGKSAALPNRYVVHALEGWGKSSLGACAPRPIFIQSRGETGLDSLIESGQLPDTPHFPQEAASQQDFIDMVRLLANEPHEFKTLVVDTINGVERLCHEEVCRREFSGEWGDQGFGSYNKGYEVALTDWRLILGELDNLRIKKQMTIFLLCHSKIATFKNPEASDYDRYVPAMHPKTWEITARWADAVLFGKYETTVKTQKGGSTPTELKKGKGSGGQQRVLCTERTAAYDAKNRLGLKPEIVMGENYREGWAAFVEALREGKAKTNG